jgi:predicted metalloprotease with PDZ domain
MNTRSTLFTTILLFFATHALMAQSMMIKADGDIFNMPELGAVISEIDGKVIVLFTEKNLRPTGYKDIDITNNDEIFMANGKKMKSVKDLTDQYNKLKPGEILKMAIVRKGERKMVKVKKADLDELPKMQIETKTISPEEAAKMEKEGGMKIIKKTISSDGSTKTEVIENEKDGKKKD